MLNLGFLNFRRIFSKIIIVLSYNFFSALLVICLSFFALLTFRNNEVRVLTGPLLRSKILRYTHFKWVRNSIFFPTENIFFPIIDTFLIFEEMEYLIHHTQFKMWQALCKFPILFSTVKLKFGNNFLQFINRFKIGTLESWPSAGCISKFFSISKEIANWDF